MKKWSFVLLVLFPFQIFAVPAKIVTPQAVVYEGPDFDAEQMATLEEGASVEVSQKKFGPFHRIRLQNGKMGYIADNDFAFKGQVKNSTVKEKLKISEKIEKEKPKKYTLAGSHLWGANLSYVVYRENTMGMNPTQKSFFWGAKFAGPDFFIEGDTYTEMNILVRMSAPEFYAQATGIPTQGWIFMPDLLVQNIQPQSKNVMTSYGYGLMFRYSKYDVGLSNGSGGTNYYSLDDMVLGAVANVGFFYRIGQMTLRGEYKLYMEKMTYWGLSFGFLFPF